ncbi:MAG: aminotransferase class V-fold PLP-dependent enzyme [Bdellovibrionaceae bacterium]|nr:aminotransferase class V-fold PLP-dependent enzyme [Bdellovibrionales bacterium]MCB9085026.1 aminotransferase class V-fold PLP-dependent enzyme [Pseudobdellovibrionaceae bacterium]
MNAVNWQDERRLYPAASAQTYLLTAAVGPISSPVMSSYQNHYQSLLQSGDIDWMENVEMLGHVRELTAQFINAHGAHEVAFGPNTSMAMNFLAMGFSSLLKSHGKKQKILSCREEFPSSTIPWLHHKYEVTQVPAKDLIQEAERGDYSMVVCSAVQFGTGYRQNLRKLGEVCRSRNVYFVVNATQALGAYPIDVQACGISAMTASCHKWMCCGYGLCVMYLSQELLKEFSSPIAGWLSMNDPLAMNNRQLDLKCEASVLEVGIPSFAIVGALGEHLKQLNRIGIENIAERILELSRYASEELSRYHEVASERTSSPSLNTCDSGILLLSTDKAGMLEEKLASRRIHVSVRQGGLRIATHFFNDHKDIDNLTDVLKEIH